MELQEYNINITFYPDKGLGNLLFSFDEKEIVNILGIPDKRKVDNFNDLEYAIYLSYYNIDISPSIYYENGSFDYLSINTEDLILDNFRFSSFSKEEILKFIKEYHHNHEIVFLLKKKYDKMVNEEYYHYENIGLTIWFEEEIISDICVQRAQNQDAK